MLGRALTSQDKKLFLVDLGLGLLVGETILNLLLTHSYSFTVAGCPIKVIRVTIHVNVSLVMKLRKLYVHHSFQAHILRLAYPSVFVILTHVSVMRKHIDSITLLNRGNRTRWNKLVPIKINILAWRLINDRLPTRSNLDSRGIDLHSLLCPVCDDNIESAHHLFVHCKLATDLWSSVYKWWNVDNVPSTLMEVITWVDSTIFPAHVKNIMDGVILTTIWVIWCYRNKICFDEKPPRKDTLMDDIKTFSFSWIVNRSKTFRPLWLDWLKDPMSACKNCL